MLGMTKKHDAAALGASVEKKKGRERSEVGWVTRNKGMEKKRETFTSLYNRSIPSIYDKQGGDPLYSTATGDESIKYLPQYTDNIILTLQVLLTDCDVREEWTIQGHNNTVYTLHGVLH